MSSPHMLVHRLSACLFAMLTAAPAVAQAVPPTPVVVVPVIAAPPPQSVNLASQARIQLDAAEALLSQAGDPEVQRRIARKLAVARALMLQIESLPGGIGVPPLVDQSQAPVHPLDRGTPPVSDREFDDIAAAVADTTFSSQQLKALRQHTRDRGLTVRQVTELMGLFTFGRDQVEAAVVLHSRVVDPDQWHMVYEVFKFSSDAEALRLRLERR